MFLVQDSADWRKTGESSLSYASQAHLLKSATKLGCLCISGEFIVLRFDYLACVIDETTA